ncbi:MAG: hypothetical protein QW146_06425 [Candidatus Bathyarchaeia archaeon]
MSNLQVVTLKITFERYRKIYMLKMLLNRCLRTAVMKAQKLLLAFSEALTIYGLIIVGYGILAIHITRTWSGDWPVDRSIPWLTLDVFIMVSFALSSALQPGDT